MRKAMLVVTLLLATYSTLTTPASNSTKSSENVIMPSIQAASQQFASEDVANEYSSSFDLANRMQLFFKEDQSIAYFEGVGSEDASYTEKTDWLSDKYIRLVKDNGDISVIQYFRVTEEGIYLLNESMKPTNFTIAQLDKLLPIATIIEAPIKIGSQFGDWTVVSTNETVETTYDTFSEVLVLMSERDGLTELKYFAPGYGLISHLSSPEHDDENPSQVASNLADIKFK